MAHYILCMGMRTSQENYHITLHNGKIVHSMSSWKVKNFGHVTPVKLIKTELLYFIGHQNSISSNGEPSP